MYYSHGRDGRHPDWPNMLTGVGIASEIQPAGAVDHDGDDHDLQRYLDFMTAQITELLTNYGPIAAIWLTVLPCGSLG